MWTATSRLKARFKATSRLNPIHRRKAVQWRDPVSARPAPTVEGDAGASLQQWRRCGRLSNNEAAAVVISSLKTRLERGAATGRQQ
jgi:hypothetical protein